MRATSRVRLSYELVVACLTADAAFVSPCLRSRRMHETTEGWKTDPSWADGSPESVAFAMLGKAAIKVVFTRTLTKARATRTRAQYELIRKAIDRVLDEASGDVTIECPTLATEAF